MHSVAALLLVGVLFVLLFLLLRCRTAAAGGHGTPHAAAPQIRNTT